MILYTFLLEKINVGKKCVAFIVLKPLCEARGNTILVNHFIANSLENHILVAYYHKICQKVKRKTHIHILHLNMHPPSTCIARCLMLVEQFHVYRNHNVGTTKQCGCQTFDIKISLKHKKVDSNI